MKVRKKVKKAKGIAKVVQTIKHYGDLFLLIKLKNFIVSMALIFILTVICTALFLGTQADAKEKETVTVDLPLSMHRPPVAPPVVPPAVSQDMAMEGGSVTAPIRYYDVTINGEVQEYVDEYIAKYGNILPKELVYSIIYTESRFDPEAYNKRSKCSGIMQLNPRYFSDEIESFGYDSIFDTEGNIEVGIWYLSKITREHNGDYMYALTSYHRGGSGAYSYCLSHGDYDSYAYEVYDRYIERTGLNAEVSGEFDYNERD